MAQLWVLALASATIAYLIKKVLPFSWWSPHPRHAALLVGGCVLIPYAGIYLAVAQAMGIAGLGPVSRIFRRRL
ncbi:MAG: hypothetical protein JO356_14540 [Acidobacteria bacterium]|nr:hypothetical protein [Acidobacteriota bacterium]